MRAFSVGSRELPTFGDAGRSTLRMSSGVRSCASISRQVCRPVLLAPGPRSPRRQRSRLVTTNFKPNDPHQEEAPVVRPKIVRHPLTEDAYAGAGASETATQEVLFHGGDGKAKQHPLLGSAANAARQLVHVLRRPRALLRALVRNSAAYGLPLILAYLARQPLQSFWTAYCSALDTYPLLIKIATGIVGTTLGDYIAQHLSHQKEAKEAHQRGESAPAFTFDAVRTSRLVIYGALVGTPIGHAWFKLLDTHIMPEAMTSPAAVLTKMGLDQLVACPLLTATFFVVMRCWEGHPNDALAYMRGKMGPTMSANYILWPLAHIINFAFVPPAQRILYCNAVGVLWTVILSTILNSRPDEGTPVAVATASGGGGGGGSGSGPSSPPRRHVSPASSPPSSPRAPRSPPQSPPQSPSRGPTEVIPGLATSDLGEEAWGRSCAWGYKTSDFRPQRASAKIAWSLSSSSHHGDA